MTQSVKQNSPDGRETSTILNTPELLTRMAEDLRVKSGSDMPLSCYIEQVKMQLASGSIPSGAMGSDPAQAANSNTAPQTSDCFRAWAMPE